MSDQSILARISALIEEEHKLRAAGVVADEGKRLQQVEVELDQCWDLLRQRRARRDAGLDPDDADLRRAEVVEHYEQ